MNLTLPLLVGLSMIFSLIFSAIPLLASSSVGSSTLSSAPSIGIDFNEKSTISQPSNSLEPTTTMQSNPVLSIFPSKSGTLIEAPHLSNSAQFYLVLVFIAAIVTLISISTMYLIVKKRTHHRNSMDFSP
jgi:hypothetical protein